MTINDLEPIFKANNWDWKLYQHLCDKFNMFYLGSLTNEKQSKRYQQAMKEFEWIVKYSTNGEAKMTSVTNIGTRDIQINIEVVMNTVVDNMVLKVAFNKGLIE